MKSLITTDNNEEDTNKEPEETEGNEEPICSTLKLFRDCQSYKTFITFHFSKR